MSSQSHKRQSDQSPQQAPTQTPIQSVESSTAHPNLLGTPDPSAPNPQRSPSNSIPQIFRIPQSSRAAPSDGHRSKAAKIAIPRLKKTVETASSSAKSSGRHRVNHACESCRQRKTKCSGERPVCTHCQDFKITCFYADGKRDRAKKYILQY
jgi:Fungal Zn(2)-Cys(6) binuclear cluster domain